MLTIVLFIVAFVIYFLPSIVGKDKRNSGAIIVLNFFLGWTLIGWVVALVWACTTDDPSPNSTIHHLYNSPDKIDRLERLTQLRNSGAISESEFQKEKAKLLGR